MFDSYFALPLQLDQLKVVSTWWKCSYASLNVFITFNQFVFFFVYVCRFTHFISEKSSKNYAIISMDDNTKPADQSLRCQIRKYNLSNAASFKGLLLEV